MGQPVWPVALALLALAAPADAGAIEAGALAAQRRTPVVEVVARAAPAVVNIATDQRVENPFGSSPFGSLFQEFFNLPRPDRERFVPNALGSGVIVDPAGYVITNEHVIVHASRIRVTLEDGRTLLAEVVGTDGESDLAVLKLQGEGPFPAVALARSDNLMIGETVVAIGNPYGFSSSVTTGVVSAIGRSLPAGDRVFSDYIQTDALINPGNSGGPLLNILGELIGINNAIYAPAQGIGFAIPVNRVRKAVNDLIHYGEVRHPWFGMLVEEYTLPAGTGSEIERRSAVRIQRTFIGSPADRGGLRPGDRIVSIQERTLRTRADYDTVLSSLAVGQSVRFVLDRAGTPLRVTLAGGLFPEDKALDYFEDVTGLALEPIPGAGVRRSRRSTGRGMMVVRVARGSRAEQYGLREGDVVVRLNQEELTSEADLRRLVPRILSRTSFFMVVVRGRFAYNLTFRVF
ncbi:MAG: trypsin-like peptidase domain-containing protein [Acidobacteriota bacterium]